MDNFKGKVGLFIGSDVTAHIILNKIVPDMLDMGYRPVIFLPDHKSNEKAKIPELQEYAFFERGLLSSVVYPYLNGLTERKYLAPEILAKRYEKIGVKCIPVPDINDPKFIARQKRAKDYIGALSIRCFQIFKPEHIQAWRDKGFLLNLHPGILPQYQGVMSVARAMADEANYGWTLHHIDAGIDTGDIINKQAFASSKSKTVLKSTIDLADSGASTIVRLFEDLSLGQQLKSKGTPQPPRGEGANYYTYPTAKELKAWRKAGVKLVDAEEVVRLYTEIFSDPLTPHGKELKSQLREAIDRAGFGENRTISPGRSVETPSIEPKGNGGFLMTSPAVALNPR